MLRHFTSRAAWLLLLLLPIASCDSKLQLAVVEQGGSTNSSRAGKDDAGGLVNVVSAGGTIGDAGSPEPPQGGNAGKSDSGPGAGGTGGPVTAGGGGMPDVPVWDAPPRYRASFVPYGFPDQYVRHVADQSFIGVIDMSKDSEKSDASFEMIPGLYNDKCSSFRSANEPGSFFRHSGSRIYLHAADTLVLYQKDATFCEEAGFADPQAITFRSVNYPTRVIHLRNVNELWIDEVPDPMTADFAADSSFYRMTALDEPVSP